MVREARASCAFNVEFSVNQQRLFIAGCVSYRVKIQHVYGFRNVKLPTNQSIEC